MFKYTVFSDDSSDREVYVDPLEVASVVNTEDRRAYGGWSQVAVIHMRNGARHKVYDEARTVGREIADAKAAARRREEGAGG